ncbi:tRNA-specific adenosine deaminase 1 [Chelonus insularis]|uniref:tRNA-specific adenosine deaminase 1 n=1 Tax=Chelonus insularis TaxID=460826 RepID=UPI00158D7D83|nr:tRNA-specific adenosine deaminase 1 [Chelonus insularis]
MSTFGDKIAKLCFDKYLSLKKTGKPQVNEWTVLAGIVLKKDKDDLLVVSLATGTKCLGANDLMNTDLYKLGSRLSDSHAEVLARRALIRYLYDQIDQLLSSASSDVFVLNENKIIEFKNNISFHFFCSQSPCGDCSIIPKNNFNTSGKDFLPLKKIKLDNEINVDNKNYETNESNLNKTGINTLVFEDIYRTGAKCLETEVKQDLHLPGINYHVTGPLRIKPGRGDPTLSLSCSDKLAKWNFLGIQGALLSLLIPTIKLETVVIGSGCPFSLDAIERGLCRRFNKKDFLPKILQSSLSFVDQKNQDKINPCPSSIVWCAVKNRPTEVVVEGRKQGATKNKKGSNLLITRREFLRSFVRIIDKHPNFKHLPSHPKKMNYYLCKQWSTDYQKSWSCLKSTIFKSWTKKPETLQYFSL